MRVPVQIRVSDLVSFHLRSLVGSAAVKKTAAYVLAALALLVLRYGNGEGVVGNLLVLILVVGGFIVFFALILTLIVGMIVANGREHGELGLMEYVVEPTGFRVEGGSKPQVYDWHRVNEIGMSNDVVWLHIDDKYFRIFPKRSLANAADLEHLWGLVQKFSQSNVR